MDIERVRFLKTLKFGTTVYAKESTLDAPIPEEVIAEVMANENMIEKTMEVLGIPPSSIPSPPVPKAVTSESGTEGKHEKNTANENPKEVEKSKPALRRRA